MINYQKTILDVYSAAGKAGRAIWRILSLSLADHIFSFAKVVCISIEADGVYLVYGEKTPWQTHFRHYRYYPPEENKPLSPEYLAGVVSSFVNEHKISKAVFVLCLPRAWTMVQQAELPLAARENLSSVISFELDRFTPLSKDNACYDYAVLGEDLKNVKILLAVARADRVQSYQEAFQIRNIHIKKVIISSFAIKSLIQNTYPQADAIYLSLRNSAYEYGVIENSLLYRSACESMDPESGSSIEGIIKRVTALSDEFIRNGKRLPIVMDADERQINVLRNRLSGMKVTSLDMDNKLNVPKQKKELSAVALGGALGVFRSDPQNINLLNRDNRAQKHMPRFLTILLITAIAAMTAFHFLMPLSYEQQKLDEMDRRIRALKPAVKKVEALRDEVAAIAGDIQAIHDFKKQNDLTMNIIKDMTAMLPPNTWLTRMKITDKTVDIEGFSASATEIILKLENSQHFQKVEFASPTYRDPRQNKDRFVIKMELKKESNAKNIKTEMKYDAKK
jgi:general secretion pathway protein L